MTDDTARVEDTYVAALQHDRYDADGRTLVGVVRWPTRWFSAAVDENVPALSPPAELLDEVQATRDDFGMRGLCDEEAHNAAFEATEFEARYREHLESETARTALDELRSRLRDGEALTLVCYENTAKKRCHRTTLREVLESGSTSEP